MTPEERAKRVEEIRADTPAGEERFDDRLFLLSELDRARADLKAYLADTAVTCAYCEARHERPVTFEDIQAHVAVCPKHPLAAALEQVRVLREAAVPAITEAALVVETLLAGDRTKPYTEIGESLRAQLPKAAGALRAAAKALAATAKGEKP